MLPNDLHGFLGMRSSSEGWSSESTTGSALIGNFISVKSQDWAWPATMPASRGSVSRKPESIQNFCPYAAALFPQSGSSINVKSY